MLEQLTIALYRLNQLMRDETRAPVPHPCLQFAASNQIYAVIGRAATVSGYEPVIQAAIAIFVTLIDSEEDDFLASGHFARSLMRLVTRVLESQHVLIGMDTETSILEMLFTIAAKIRLQPDILQVWFQSTAKPELEDVFVKEKKSFVGITQKDDFPLCYLMIDRVHHEGRIGDFARTGLLYIFEATGRSLDLEEWVVSSDLPTLMASGLGALYSQLSRELSILHPDATLPAVLAMSDYSTTNPKATAESAFSERHHSHMATFLSYLAFWQDVLDHCRSADVKQTLLDHFHILFLQQLLYPSLLQSSDTDAGSSVAVLTYITAMLESLEYPDLVSNMLRYLLAIKEDLQALLATPTTPVRPSMPPRSPTAQKRRQSLMILTAPKNPEDVMEPALFNLVDLVINSVGSNSGQTVYAALKLVSTLMTRQKAFVFGTLLRVQRTRTEVRTVGALEEDLAKYTEVAETLHRQFPLDEVYAALCEDVRHSLEAQDRYSPPTDSLAVRKHEATCNVYLIPPNDPLLCALQAGLRTFFSNGVDVNLALTQAIISIASTIELRLDPWFALDTNSYLLHNSRPHTLRPWQAYLDEHEKDALPLLQQAFRRPVWSDKHAPLIWKTLHTLSQELEEVRTHTPNLDTLLSARKHMLQEASIETVKSEPQSPVNNPTQQPFSDVPPALGFHNRSSSTNSLNRGRKATSSPHSSLAASPPALRPSGPHANSPPAVRSIFQPPPPEMPSTTDQLMQKVVLPNILDAEGHVTSGSQSGERSASLNHVLTNVVVLQEFVLELTAVLQVRAAVLGEREVRLM